jgi:hypothetical protein
VIAKCARGGKKMYFLFLGVSRQGGEKHLKQNLKSFQKPTPKKYFGDFVPFLQI